MQGPTPKELWIHLVAEVVEGECGDATDHGDTMDAVGKSCDRASFGISHFAQ